MTSILQWETCPTLASTFHSLDRALDELNEAAIQLDACASASEVSIWKLWSPHRRRCATTIINRKYKLLERQFLYNKGLDGRPLFKHVVFAPGLWTGYSGATFPSLIEAIEARNWTNAQVRGEYQPCISRGPKNLLKVATAMD